MTVQVAVQAAGAALAIVAGSAAALGVPYMVLFEDDTPFTKSGEQADRIETEVLDSIVTNPDLQREVVVEVRYPDDTITVDTPEPRTIYVEVPAPPEQDPGPVTPPPTTTPPPPEGTSVDQGTDTTNPETACGRGDRASERISPWGAARNRANVGCHRP